MSPEVPPFGSVVHVELYSDDPQATQAFYEQAFGWTFYDVEGMEYTMFEAQGPPHGGLVGRERIDHEDAPATLPYIYVEDLETTFEAIEAADGTVLGEPVEIPQVGRIAVFEAPGGMIHALWQDLEETETNARVPEPDPPNGSIVHLELHSEDTEATEAFYEEVFDWSFEALPETDYRIITLPSPPDGGILPRQGEGFVPPHTLTYILVEEVNGALARVHEAGGKVLGERYEIEEFGAFGVFEAPGGIVQAVWERPGGDQGPTPTA